MSAVLWLLIALPLGGGGVLAMSGRLGSRVAAPVGVGVAAATLGLAIPVALAGPDRPEVTAPFLLGVPFGLAVDGLSAIFVVTTAAVTFLILVYSAGELGRDPARYRFFGLMLMFAGAMLVTVTATNLLVLLLAWEVMGATSYALIAYWWWEPHRVGAGNTAFWTTRFADVGLYIAAGAALAGAGTLAFDALPDAVGGWLHLATAGVIVAALGKSAQLPLSFWLSRAMEGPSPTSALLHSAAMVAAGGYLLLRLAPLVEASGWGSAAVAWVGAATALLLGVVAVAQRDLKQLLAASTSAQIGFVVIGAGVGGIAGGATQFVAHAAAKSLLFLGAGAWLTALGTKDIAGLRGAARRYPMVGLTTAAGLWTLAGLPPFSIWVAKDEVLAAALKSSPTLYLVGLAATFVSAAYAVKALTLLWWPAPPDAEHAYDTERPGTRQVGWLQLIPLPILAGVAAVLGVQIYLPLEETYKLALDASGEPSATWWELLLSAGVALAAGALVAVRPGLQEAVPAAFGRWLDLQRSATVLVIRPTLWSARTLARFDDRVLDRMVVEGLMARTVGLARALGRFDDRVLDGLLVETSVAHGFRRLGLLARRPQTGQLHHYYAQAATALGVVVAVFLIVWWAT